MQDWGGDCDVYSDEADFNGGFNMAGKAMGNDGKPHNVGFDVDVTAHAGVEWQSDEQPTGWNYRSDSPTYTSTSHAVVGDVTISSVAFSEDAEFVIDDESYSLHDAQQLISRAAISQLLDPEIYKKLVNSLFDKKAANVDPPEPDYHEPERGESRW
jgi:hypothetical protein